MFIHLDLLVFYCSYKRFIHQVAVCGKLPFVVSRRVCEESK